jgi:hypothetical protein
MELKATMNRISFSIMYQTSDSHLRGTASLSRPAADEHLPRLMTATRLPFMGRRIMKGTRPAYPGTGFENFRLIWEQEFPAGTERAA